MNAKSADTTTCLTCGTPISAEVLGGKCPVCLKKVALMEPTMPGDTLSVSLRPRSKGTRKEPDIPQPEELAALLPGDHYTVESFLGAGGMGAVYKGTQVRLQRKVAIKIMRQDQAVDAEFRLRFLREAQMLARLNHPGIVNVIDCGEAGPDFLFIVMEFVDGANLMDVIRSGGVSEARALTIMKQVCEALACAHNAGVVHRDIKPGNMLVDVNDRIKVADFGLARLIHAEDSMLLTTTGKVMGTPGYMAPEQLRGEKVDQRTDLYAVGALIYELLCGERPEGVFDPPSTRAGCDPRWDEIVSRAMQPDPAARYASAAEVRKALDALENSPASAARLARLRMSIIGILLAAIVWFVWSRWPSPGVAARSPFPTAAAPAPERRADTPMAATKDAPFINSLDMKFVPVQIAGGPTDGKRVLFSVWETRVADFDRFIEQQKKWTWSKPVFRQEIDHPAVLVSWNAAQDFCTWLTEVDRKAGKLSARDRYRLPTDHEWSCAVGIGVREDAAKLPAEKHATPPEVYPWGDPWLDQRLPGNYGGTELRPLIESGAYRHLTDVLPSHADMFTETGSAETYAANPFGLYDLGGNAWEWCEDSMDAEKTKHVLRGASWASGRREQLLSNYRHSATPDSKSDEFGFRCVLELSE